MYGRAPISIFGYRSIFFLQKTGRDQEEKDGAFVEWSTWDDMSVIAGTDVIKGLQVHMSKSES